MMSNINFVQAQGKLINAAYGGGVKAVYNLSRGAGPLADLAQKVIDLLETNLTLEEAVSIMLIEKGR